MTGVRFRADTGWEGKCDACATYWPLTDEFWYPRQGCRRCRACINETQTRGARYHRAQMTADELAARRHANHLRKQRDWMAARRFAATVRKVA